MKFELEVSDELRKELGMWLQRLGVQQRLASDREREAADLLREVLKWDSNASNADCIGCDTDPCIWRTKAQKWLQEFDRQTKE